MKTAPIALLFALLSVDPVLASDITQCGQVVGRNEVGTLTGDLDCSTTAQRFCARPCNVAGLCGFTDDACTTAADCPSSGLPRPCIVVGVTLERGARLEMGGFSIVDPSSDEPNIGVGCSAGSCTITGPGEIDGFQQNVFATGRATVSDVTVRNGRYGISGRYARLANVVATNNSAYGIATLSLRLDGPVDSSGNPGTGVGTSRLSGRGLTVNGNGGDGLSKGSGVSGSFLARELVAQNNGGAGVISIGGARFIDSNITGNNGGGVGADIALGRQPRLMSSTCGKSTMTNFTGTWGVCTND